MSLQPFRVAKTKGTYMHPSEKETDLSVSFLCRFQALCRTICSSRRIYKLRFIFCVNSAPKDFAMLSKTPSTKLPFASSVIFFSYERDVEKTPMKKFREF